MPSSTFKCVLNIYVEVGITVTTGEKHILSEMKIFEQAGLVVVVEVT